MAITGLIQQRGSTVTVRRSARAQASDGSFNTAWASAVIDTKALLEAVTSDLAQRLWGQETQATLRAFFAPDTDVRVGDGIRVTAGAYVATKYRVAAVLPRDFSAASRHVEVALELTKETFE